MTVQYTGEARTPCLTCVLKSHLQRVTRPDAVIIQYDLLRMSRVVLKHVEGCNKCIRINNVCIKMEKKTIII